MIPADLFRAAVNETDPVPCRTFLIPQALKHHFHPDRRFGLDAVRQRVVLRTQRPERREHGHIMRADEAELPVLVVKFLISP